MATSYRWDITFENETHNGLNTCVFVRQLVQRYPPLKPLTLVLKQFLVERGLNDPFVGGLSSYGLVLMIVAVLQGQPNAATAHNLGELFVRFLEAYSTPDFLSRGVRLVGARPGVHHGVSGVSDPLYIEDPLDPRNNVGRTCFGVSQVVQAFEEALTAVRLSTAPATEDAGLVDSGAHFFDGPPRTRGGVGPRGVVPAGASAGSMARWPRWW